MPQVSVIIPTYNRAHLVGDAIQSALNQIFSDLEIIVVDDGSTDNTTEVVQRFHDPRIKYLRRENGGPAAARNTGLAIASGAYISFLDSDDLLLPETLLLQLDGLGSSDLNGLVYGQYYVISSPGEARYLHDIYDDNIGLRQLLLGPQFVWPTVLIRRSWLEKTGGFDETLRIGEEWELTLRLAMAGCQFVCVKKPLAIIRVQPHSLSRELHHYDPHGTKVLDKIFSNSSLPEEYLELREVAYKVQHVKHAGSAFLAGDFETGETLLHQVFRGDNKDSDEENFDFLVAQFVTFIFGLSLGKTKDVLDQVVKCLSRHGERASRFTMKIWEKYYVEAAFQAYQRKRRFQCVKYIARAILHNPRCLQNRGLASILARSLIGDKSIEIIKKASN